MRRTLAAFAVAAVVAAGCRRAPPEPVEVEGGMAPAAVAAPSSSAEADEPVDAGSADSGLRGAVHEFCSGAFSADDERMRGKCSASDFDVNQRMGKAAANVCAADFAIALGRGRADFDAEAGRRCVEMLHDKGLAQASETDTLFQHFPCDRVLLGHQPEGQACRFSIECKDGLACVGYKIGVDGVCKKPPAPKEACTPQPYGSLINEAASWLHHPACAAGAYCDGTTCQTRVAPGKACTASGSCRTGLSCVTGKCGLRVGAGAACESSTDCAFGLWCQGGANRCAVKRGEGEGCPTDDACKGRCSVPKRSDGRAAGPGKCEAICGSG